MQDKSSHITSGVRLAGHIITNIHNLERFVLNGEKKPDEKVFNGSLEKIMEMLVI